MAQVIIENLYKSFIPQKKKKTKQEETQQDSQKSHSMSVLKGINLTVAEGEFMVLVGPSGCGKSTLLRLLAGLEDITGGKIWLGDLLINDFPPKERDMAMVFQNYALYPHLNVYDNIAFGLRRMSKNQLKQPVAQFKEKLFTSLTSKLPRKMRYTSKSEKNVSQQVLEVAKLLQIESLLNRLPKQLSGGQKQRVALGRAIARNPEVFLMDEPLSNLDAKLRAETRSQIVKLQRKLGITTIYVTHDQTEAMTMGDRIAVMNKGEIQQIATPLEIYHQPANKFVAEFIGSPAMNFITVKVNKNLLVTHASFEFTLPSVWEQTLKNYRQERVILGVRPEDFEISSADVKNIPVIVDLVEALGNETFLSVHLRDDLETKMQVRVSPEYDIKIGDRLWLSINVNKVHIFDDNTGENQLPKNNSLISKK